MNEKQFWQFAFEAINQNHRIVLLVVAESSNSSPGRTGFKMLLRDDGVQQGTIGGGIMEKKMMEYSLSLIAGNETEYIKQLQHSGESDLEKSGLICGGFQTILFTLLDGKSSNLIKNILENISERRNGTLQITNGVIKFSQDREPDSDIKFDYDGRTFTYEESLGFTDTVYIAGGGHVGLAVSRIMKSIGFYVIVFDHRENIFTMDGNDYADEKIVADYKSINKYVTEGKKSYLVITTPMHMGDREALGSVLGMDLKYIGMMGSSKKIKTTFNALIDRGFKKELLETVHTPIGLEIFAETPEEIAISIAAEIIKIKHQI